MQFDPNDIMIARLAKKRPRQRPLFSFSLRQIVVAIPALLARIVLIGTIFVRFDDLDLIELARNWVVGCVLAGTGIGSLAGRPIRGGLIAFAFALVVFLLLFGPYLMHPAIG
jgi:hypothetical protein